MNAKVVGDDGDGYYHWLDEGIYWAADNGFVLQISARKVGTVLLNNGIFTPEGGTGKWTGQPG